MAKEHLFIEAATHKERSFVIRGTSQKGDMALAKRNQFSAA